MNRRDRLRAAVGEALASTDAGAFVHVGPAADPGMRYCLDAIDQPRVDAVHAIGVTDEGVLACGPATGEHPAAALGERLSEGLPSGTDTLAVPLTIPHDAALALEATGFSLTSSDALARARERKTAGERERIERAQRAASAGVCRGAAVLSDAVVADDDPDSDGRALAFEGEPLTAERLRREVDAAIVHAGGFPGGRTRVHVGASEEGHNGGPDGSVRAGDPIAIAVTPREPAGYHGHLERTLVVDGEGGWERRAHVAVTRAFESAGALCRTDEPTVAAIEADLEAEIRAFGLERGIETVVDGIGLEPREAPRAGAVPTGAVCRLEASVGRPAGERVAVADLLVRTAADAEWLDAPSRSLSADRY